MLARELATATEASEATISRLLSGDRKPSLDLMLRIRAVTDWALEDQADCLQIGMYAGRLKEKMESADAPSVQVE